MEIELTEKYIEVGWHMFIKYNALNRLVVTSITIKVHASVSGNVTQEKQTIRSID